MEDCPILPGRSRSLATLDLTSDYEAALQRGFRRGLRDFTKETCAACSACKPIRIDLDAFTRQRSLSKIANKNNGLDIHLFDNAGYIDLHEHCALFASYLKARARPGNDAAFLSRPENMAAMLLFGPSPFRVMELRTGHDSKLIGAALFDNLQNSIVGGHYYFQPDEGHRSPGIFMILKLAEMAKAEGKKYFYLGSWTQEPSGLSYKSRFSGTEIYDKNHWRPL